MCKKNIACLTRVLCLFAILIMTGIIGMASAENADKWDVKGRWLVEGAGYGEKNFLRVLIELDGYMDILTVPLSSLESNLDVNFDALKGQDYENCNVLTSYDIKLNLDLTRLGIGVWKDSYGEPLHTPVALPELSPTVNNPFTIGPWTSKDGLKYILTIDSENSGIVDIEGDIDIDGVGSVHIDSQSAIWKQGTSKPDIEDKSSGCNSGAAGLAALAGVLLLLFLKCSLKYRRQ